ncbi:MAG TPA: DUF362 domain-containing protein [bacterium]
MILKNENNSNAFPRRQFIKSLGMGAFALMSENIFPRILKATSTTYPPRTRLPNPFISSEGKPLLVVVRGNDFQAMLKTGLEKIGGLKKLINNNQDVLIKPNLNSVDVFPAISSAELIATLAKTVVAATTGKVIVGDVSFHTTSSVYQHTDLANVLANTGAELIYFDKTYNVRRASWSGTKPDYLVYSDVYDAPIIISLANIKRHFLARMSTALKNNVGCVAGSGASQSRGYFHGLLGDPFLEEVAEIAGLINPELTIVDARSMLIGNGPFSNMQGAKILEDTNYLIISSDMNAVDHYCAMLLQGLDATFSSAQIAATLQHAYSLGLGVKDLTEVEIIETTTDVKDSHGHSIPNRLELNQNYPNPFNSSTQIEFKLADSNLAKLNVYDARGRKINTLLDGELFPGEYSLKFDGGNLASGAYFYQLKAGQQLLTKKMMLVR